ncbi:MAG TPA: TetR/AcrR family transcriptional regulator [Candidatus Limnocylindria bacterium]
MATRVKGRRAYRTTLRDEQSQATRQRILESARRLLVRGGYSQVTMQELAREAGVAYQTLYAQFGNKTLLAHELIKTGFPHVREVVAVIEEARDARDPERWLRVTATFARRMYEPCADLFRFMRESGDPALLAHYREVAASRLRRFALLGPQLEASGRLRVGLSGSEAIDLVWLLSSPETYEQLVLDRGWTPSRFEEWLGGALVGLILSGKHRSA